MYIYHVIPYRRNIDCGRALVCLVLMSASPGPLDTLAVVITVLRPLLAFLLCPLVEVLAAMQVHNAGFP